MGDDVIEMSDGRITPGGSAHLVASQQKILDSGRKESRAAVSSQQLGPGRVGEQPFHPDLRLFARLSRQYRPGQGRRNGTVTLQVRRFVVISEQCPRGHHDPQLDTVGVPSLSAACAGVLGAGPAGVRVSVLCLAVGRVRVGRRTLGSGTRGRRTLGSSTPGSGTLGRRSAGAGPTGRRTVGRNRAGRCFTGRGHVGRSIVRRSTFGPSTVGRRLGRGAFVSRRRCGCPVDGHAVVVAADDLLPGDPGRRARRP